MSNIKNNYTNLCILNSITKNLDIASKITNNLQLYQSQLDTINKVTSTLPFDNLDVLNDKIIKLTSNANLFDSLKLSDKITNMLPTYTTNYLNSFSLDFYKIIEDNNFTNYTIPIDTFSLGCRTNNISQPLIDSIQNVLNNVNESLSMNSTFIDLNSNNDSLLSFEDDIQDEDEYKQILESIKSIANSLDNKNASKSIDSYLTYIVNIFAIITFLFLLSDRIFPDNNEEQILEALNTVNSNIENLIELQTTGSTIK